MRYAIHNDPTPSNPRTEYDPLGTMVCFHGRYYLGDKHTLKSYEFKDWNDLRKHLIDRLGAAVILPLYLLDHSGLALRTTPFNDPWDSGQVGFIYMTRSQILKEAPGRSTKVLTPKKKEWAERYLESEVAEYAAYLAGEVYGYEILDEAGECLDSCWGYYGREVCEQLAKESMALLMAKEAA